MVYVGPPNRRAMDDSNDATGGEETSGIEATNDVGGTDEIEESDEAAEFDRVRNRAVEAIGEDDLDSVYVGLIHEGGRNEFYFGNDVDETELQGMAMRQLGMMARVLAEQSEASVDEITRLAGEAAEDMDLR